jgi:hypothetical protein
MRESPAGFHQRRPKSPEGAEARGSALQSHTPCTDDTSLCRGVSNKCLWLDLSLVGENIVPVLVECENIHP